MYDVVFGCLYNNHSKVKKYHPLSVGVDNINEDYAQLIIKVTDHVIHNDIMDVSLIVDIDEAVYEIIDSNSRDALVYEPLNHWI